MKSAPCKDCQDRSIGCHGNCQKYIMFKVNNDLFNQAKRNSISEIQRYNLQQMRRTNKLNPKFSCC